MTIKRIRKVWCPNCDCHFSPVENIVREKIGKNGVSLFKMVCPQCHYSTCQIPGGLPETAFENVPVREENNEQ